MDIILLAPVLACFNLEEIASLGLVCKHFRLPLLSQFKRSLRGLGVTPRSRRIFYWAHRAGVREMFHGSLLPQATYMQCFSQQQPRSGLGGLLPTGVSGAILRDVTRTFSHLEQVDHDQLANVLFAVSVFCPQVSYCQGMNYVCAVLLMETKLALASAVDQECLAFAIMCGLIDNLSLGRMWSPGVPQLKLRIFQFDRMFAEHLPELALHFKRIELTSDVFVSQWFLTLMSVNFINGGSISEQDSLNSLLLVWDVFLTEGWKAIFRVGLHCLQSHSVWLQQQNLELVCKFLKRGLMGNVRGVVDWKWSRTVTNHRLHLLEREYESHVLLRSSSMVRQMIVLNDDSPVLRSDVTVLRERIERTEHALRASVSRLQQFSRLCSESTAEIAALQREGNGLADNSPLQLEQQRLAKLVAGANQAKVEVEEHLERKGVFSEQLRQVVERNELSRASRLRNLFEEMNL